MSVLASKVKEVLLSVLPITAIVLILHLTLTPLESASLARFLIGAAMVTVGLSIFLFGVDIGITPIGNEVGSGIARTNKLWIVLLSGLILGFIVSVAEPDLHILAGQVSDVTKGLVSKPGTVAVVSVGIAVLLAAGLWRTIYGFPLYKMLLILYLGIFLISLFTSQEFLAISFDASGATTGALTVPFILALAVGVSEMKKDSKASEKDSFGLVAIASTGAILSVMIVSILSKQEVSTAGLEYSHAASGSLLGPFSGIIGVISSEIFIALLPILIVFLILQVVYLKLPKRTVRRILIGGCLTFIGLVLFLVGVNGGFMDVGRIIGNKLASLESKAPLVAIGFVLGCVTILAEPAVYVLTHQIEEVTSGYVRRKVVLITLAIGVGFSVGLSMVRILVPGIRLWHYLLPGYAIALAMSFSVPKLFVGIAFDSGGVASGPMTATFILAFAQGAADAIEGADVIVDGFGMIAMVALTPLIALQILGMIFKQKSRRRGIDGIDV
mgnify:CR=1 FL=1